MDWLFPSIISSFVGTLILAAVYSYFYYAEREQFMGIWAISWAFYSVRFLFELYFHFSVDSLFIIFFIQFLSLLSGAFLLWGTYKYLNKKVPLVFIALAVASSLWLLFTIFLHLSFLWIALPIFFFLGYVYLLTGYSFLTSKNLIRTGAKIVGITFVFWGLHKINYPILRTVDWFAPWGFLLGAVFEFVVAIGILIVYFEKKSNALEMSEAKYRILLQQQNDLVVKFTPDLKLTFANQSYCQLFGQAEQDLIGRSFIPRLVEEDRSSVKDSISSLSKGKLTTSHEERVIIDGDVLWLEWSAKAIIGSNGEIKEIVSVGRDITARKEAESALKASEEKYRTLVESLYEGIWVIDQDSNTSFVNKRLADMLGYTSEEMIGKHLFTFMNEEGKTQAIKYLEKRKKGIKEDHEFTFIHKDGHDIYTQVSAAALMDNQGIYRGAIAGIMDLTDYKATKEALQESERQLFTLLNNLPGMAYRCKNDSQWTMLFLSKGCLSLTGYHAESLLNNKELSFGDLIIPDDRQMVWDQTQRSIQKDNSYILTYRIHNAKKEIRWIWEQGIAVTDPESEESYLEGYITDITDFKRAENELRDSRERYSLVVDGVNDGLWDWNLETNEVYFSPRWKAILGYEDHEILDRFDEWEKRVHPDDLERTWKQINDYLEGKELEYKVEFRMRHKDGKYRWIVARGVCIRDETGRAKRIAGSHTDITKEKNAEIHRLQLEEQLRQSQKMEAIGRLAGGVAHDFNNILTVIQGFSDLIENRLKEGDPILHDIQEIMKATESATSLTEQLLAFSRKQLISPKVVDLGELVDRSLQMLKRIVGEDIELQCECEEKIWPTKLDTSQVDQILVNLTVNARDAMPKGGSMILKLKNVSLKGARGFSDIEKVEGDYVAMMVQDRGLGMDHDTLDRIFEPFFSTKEKDKGSGLGLATVYGIVKQNNGYIKVESTPNHGSTFTIIFPKVNEEVQKITSEKKVLPVGGNETILLVEDQEVVRTLARRILENAGYTVFDAEDGIKAKSVFMDKTDEIDLLLTDVVLPKKYNGPELYEELAKIKPELKVLFMSGYAEEAIAQQGELPAGTNFIAKPFKRADLLMSLVKVLKSDSGDGDSNLILIVDDEESLLLSASSILREKGYDVITAENGAKGLELAINKSAEIGIVLLDKNLPDKSTDEMIAGIRNRCPSIPIMLTSGEKVEKLDNYKSRFAPVDFLAKPFRMKQLLEAVEKYL